MATIYANLMARCCIVATRADNTEPWRAARAQLECRPFGRLNAIPSTVARFEERRERPDEPCIDCTSVQPRWAQWE